MSRRIEQLSLSIRHEARKTGFLDRLKYWLNREIPPVETGESQAPLLSNMLNSLTKKDLQSPDAINVAGAGWEFQFGQQPPPEITKARERLLQKAQAGQSLTPSEQDWYNIIALDADMF